MKAILDEMYLFEFLRNGGIIIYEDGTEVDMDSYVQDDDEIREDVVGGRIGRNEYIYNPGQSWMEYVSPKEKLDKKDPYGIKNCNFTLISDSDVRWDEFAKQRKERGFDDSELWSLDYTIASFIYPRLKAFLEDSNTHLSYPAIFENGQKEWAEVLEKMLFSFDCIIKNKDIVKNQEKFDEGMELFKKYFTALWN